MNPSPDLRARVLAAAASAPSPTRAGFRIRTAIFAGLAFLGTVAFFFAEGGVDRGGRGDLVLLGTAALWAAIGVLVTWLGARPSRSMLTRPRGLMVAALAATAPALALTALLVLFEEGRHAAPRVHLACGLFTVGQGLLPLVALAVVRRGGDPLHPSLTGASLGLAAGVWAALMAHLRCPYVDVPHILLAHVVPVVLLALVGAAVGAHFLRVRLRAS